MNLPALFKATFMIFVPALTIWLSAFDVNAMASVFSKRTAPTMIALDQKTPTGVISSTEEVSEGKDFEIVSVDVVGKEPAQSEAESFLKKLEEDLSLSKTDFKQILNKITDSGKRWELARRQKISLQSQLRALDDEVFSSKMDLVGLLRAVIAKENRISQLYRELEKQKMAGSYQKEQIADYIRLLYMERKSLLSDSAGEGIETVKLLLDRDSVGENLREIRYLDILSEAGQQMIDSFEKNSQILEIYSSRLKEERLKLRALENEMQAKQKDLQEQQAGKQKLLALTQGQEKIFAQLYQQSILEQEEAVNDLKNLDAAISELEEDIKTGKPFAKEKYEKKLGDRGQILADFYLKNPDTEVSFSWPVDPNRKGLSAYFNDPTYKEHFGVAHKGIDIPALQGTPVRAAEDGVVFSAKDNGYGYSYVMLAHADGFRTVYGHMSGILVKSGQVVREGEIIGLSGGMPGTKGAGYMTTGPHLHFEILKNEKHVDPLQFMPLQVLEEKFMDTLPEKFQKLWKKF